MAQGHHYGNPLAATVKGGRLLIDIGVQTLAHAASYADWSNPFDEALDDYIRRFAITDVHQFAKDVVHAMLDEREDGSTPLSDFLDTMMQSAVNDGSLGLDENEHVIKHGTTHPLETWASQEG